MIDRAKQQREGARELILPRVSSKRVVEESIPEIFDRALSCPATEKPLLIGRFHTGNHFTYIQHDLEPGTIELTVTSIPREDGQCIPLRRIDGEEVPMHTDHIAKFLLKQGGFTEIFTFNKECELISIEGFKKYRDGSQKQYIPEEDPLTVLRRLTEERRILPREDDYVPLELLEKDYPDDPLGPFASMTLRVPFHDSERLNTRFLAG